MNKHICIAAYCDCDLEKAEARGYESGYKDFAKAQSFGWKVGYEVAREQAAKTIMGFYSWNPMSIDFAVEAIRAMQPEQELFGLKVKTDPNMKPGTFRLEKE